MAQAPISFASIFTKDNDLNPLCSICFFVSPEGWASANTILHYLAQKIIPGIACMIPNSDADSVAFAIQDGADEVKKVFGVDCQGILMDYNLSICANT